MNTVHRIGTTSYRSLLLASRLFTTSAPISRKKQKIMEQQSRWNNKIKDNAKDLPKFQSLIRKVYLRSHPDLIRSSLPEYAKINEASMQVCEYIVLCMHVKLFENVYLNDE